MKIADATIDIRPRSASELVDLAVVFYRRHFGLLFALTAIFGFPAVLLAVSVHHLTHQGWLAPLVLMLLLPLHSGAVVLAASRIVFGASLTVRELLALYGAVWGKYFGRKLWENFIAMLLSPLVVGYVLHLTFAYTGPVGLLEQLKGKDLRVRRKGLLRRGGGNSLAFDVLAAVVVTVMVVGVISILELMLGTVFTVWQETGIRTTEVFDDPVRLGIWMTTVVALYPVYALGWFFRYLDARIRAEGWDLELDFRRAASRLSTGESP